MSILIPRNRSRRIVRGLILAFVLLAGLIILRDGYSPPPVNRKNLPQSLREETYPVPPDKAIHLPRNRKANIPKIQYDFPPESPKAKKVRLARLKEVRGEFLHAWGGYKKEAWGNDELRPVTGGFKSPFCGWAATMVDSLDTLLIMGLHEEFSLALKGLQKIDFKNTEGCRINLFETTIRHLGGLLSAWDLSRDKNPILIEKAVELGEVLYTAFDTPNRMPSPHFLWSWNDTESFDHNPSTSVVVAVLGSLQLEFTRLAQITGNEKYFDAVQRIVNALEVWQLNTLLPGMWPTRIDSTGDGNESAILSSPFAKSGTFTLGPESDSAYEYLPKQYMLLGGRLPQYKKMYEKFVEGAKKHLFFRPMTVEEKDILISGTVHVAQDQKPELQPELQHLTCFTGGMLAIAGKIFNRPQDVEIGGKLTDGCIWAYQNTATGIMPEAIMAVPCKSKTECRWNSTIWQEAVSRNEDKETLREIISSQKLTPGFAKIVDARYLLRPEAIESIFILYRITGSPHYLDSGWKMFKSIIAHTRTGLAHSAIENVMDSIPQHADEMESFWLAETLKYFYMLFSEPSVVSLDEFVLNTEAHPLRRPV